MKTGYFAPLVTKPIIIDREGQYKTRCGELVNIFRVSNKNDFGCSGKYLVGNIVYDSWHRSGRIFAQMESGNDIVSFIS